MLTLGLKAGGPPAVQTKAPRSCCLERLCWEGAVLCSALEGSLEFPNRMRLFDRKPFSATLVRAGRTFWTNHFTLRMCSSDPLGPYLECLVVRVVRYDVLGVSHFYR